MEFLVREFDLVFFLKRTDRIAYFLVYQFILCVPCAKKSLNQIRRFAHNNGSARQIMGNRNAIFVEECIFIILNYHL